MKTKILTISLLAAAMVAALGAGDASAVRPNDCGHAGGEVITLIDPDFPDQAICHCRGGGIYNGLAVYGDFHTLDGRTIHCLM